MRYFVLTFAWTWVFWWSAALTGRTWSEPPVPLLIVLGGLGPALGAWWAIPASNLYRREFLRRFSDPKRISPPWWMALGAVSVLPAFVGYLAAVAFGRTPIDETAVTFGSVLFVLGFALVAGLIEEPGWRGAALDGMPSRMSPAWAAILIGIPWTVWHLPLQFVEDSYQHSLGFGSTRFWLAYLVRIPLSVLYVWLCKGSGDSILIAILAHAGTNAAGSLIPQNGFSDLVAFLAILLAASVVIWSSRGRLSLSDPAVH